MEMTPEQFFYDFVKGNQQDSIDNPGSLRCAFNAAVAASHMADHYFHYHDRRSSGQTYGSLPGLRDHIDNATNGAFSYIRSIADAYKHLYLTRYSSDISSAGAVYSIAIPNKNGPVQDLVGHEDDEDGNSVVWFKTKDDNLTEFQPTLKAVVDFWQALLR